LMALRTKARKMPLDGVGGLKDSDPGLFGALACAREAFPVMPLYLNDDGSLDQREGSLAPGHRPFATVRGVETVGGLLDKVSDITRKR
jgi:hypothetical protein